MLHNIYIRWDISASAVEPHLKHSSRSGQFKLASIANNWMCSLPRLKHIKQVDDIIAEIKPRLESLLMAYYFFIGSCRHRVCVELASFRRHSNCQLRLIPHIIWKGFPPLLVFCLQSRQIEYVIGSKWWKKKKEFSGDFFF